MFEFRTYCRFRKVVSQFISGILLTLAVALSACEATRDSEPAQSNTSSPLTVLIAGVRENASVFESPVLQNSPADLLFTPALQSESFVLRSLLTLDEASLPSIEGALIGFIAHIDRLSLNADSASARPDSAWQYNDVLRSYVATDVSLGKNTAEAHIDTTTPDASVIAALRTASPRQSVQRLALNLAGAETGSMWVGSHRIDMSMSRADVTSCARAYRWRSVVSEHISVELSFSLSACPAMQILGDLITWQAQGFAVSGYVSWQNETDKPIRLPVSGHGWLQRSRGNVPVNVEAPVVIDSLQLRLDDGRLLSVTRSKRRSGSGPKPVVANLRLPDGSWQDIALSWQDSARLLQSESAGLYPESIRLQAADDFIDIEIAYLKRVLEAPDPAVFQINVPVLVSGSQQGSGFMSYSSIPAAP